MQADHCQDPNAIPLTQEEISNLDQDARTKQDEVQKNILNFLRSKGYDDTLTYGGSLSSS